MRHSSDRDATSRATLVESRQSGPLRVDVHRLDNGLTIIHQPDHRAPVLSYQTWFRVGSRHERKGKTGIAHLFEHLMFKGTTNMPEGEFDRRIEALGGRINAATWLDWTYYYEDVPQDALDVVVALEADRMEHMILDHDQLEAERLVVMNERKERVDNEAAGQLAELLWSRSFTRHPYGQPTIGWMDDIAALTLDDCLGFYKTWYAPNNATLVVAGAVDGATLIERVQAAYGHLAPQPIPTVELVIEPRQTEVRRFEQRLPLSADRLVMGYHAPAATDRSAAALEVLNEALFEGDSSRLQRALVTDGELAAGFYAFVPAFREPGLYEVSVDLRDGTEAEAAEDVLLDHFARVCRDGLDATELEKAKNRLETRFYRQLQTVQQRAAGLGYWAITADDCYELFVAADRLRAVTADDVVEVAREVLRPDNRTVVIGRPAD
ncbi:MAG: insulinase family protein [Myxococcales bacterium]|nr:insulinase family protein [Myxococcales bacterium]